MGSPEGVRASGAWTEVRLEGVREAWGRGTTHLLNRQGADAAPHSPYPRGLHLGRGVSNLEGLPSSTHLHVILPWRVVAVNGAGRNPLVVFSKLYLSFVPVTAPAAPAWALPPESTPQTRRPVSALQLPAGSRACPGPGAWTGEGELGPGAAPMAMARTRGRGWHCSLQDPATGASMPGSPASAPQPVWGARWAAAVTAVQAEGTIGGGDRPLFVGLLVLHVRLPEDRRAGMLELANAQRVGGTWRRE